MTKAEKDELINFRFQVMEEKISETLNTVKELSKKIDEMNGKSVSKEDHEENRRRIEKLEEKTDGFSQKIAWASGVAVVVTFLASQSFDKIWK